MSIDIIQRLATFGGALAALSATAAYAQQQSGCMSFGGMTMCQDGRMSFGGQWFAVPAPPINGFVIRNDLRPGETATWSAREFVNPDGSRTQRWERTVRSPDGTTRTEHQDRIMFPDGRVCVQDGPTLRCP